MCTYLHIMGNSLPIPLHTLGAATAFIEAAQLPPNLSPN
jgi:hypothetical protein